MIETKSFGLDIKITAKGQSFRCPIALYGRFQAQNTVIAAAAAHASGMPLHICFRALPILQPVRGRMEPIYGHPNGANVIIDFAHTPQALMLALAALREQTAGKLYLVFGCGGNRDKGKRSEMGKVAAKLADHIIITDDNPRDEDPATIRMDIAKTCPEAELIAGRETAIQRAITQLEQGDSLLIAGKGHESVQLIGTETLPFDDASIARHALSTLSHKESA